MGVCEWSVSCDRYLCLNEDEDGIMPSDFPEKKNTPKKNKLVKLYINVFKVTVTLKNSLLL